MNIYSDSRFIPFDTNSVVTVGTFDGVHAGHRQIFHRLVESAKETGARSVVVTFEPHPRRFFAPHSPAFRLERLSTKLGRLRDAGVERVYMPRFNAGFAGRSAEGFLEEILAGALGARAVITGENFAFGRDRGGDIHTLRVWGATNGVEIIAVPPVRFGEAICSSSAIRAELAMGDVVAAGHLLGRAYTLEGRIVHGDGRGKTIGFPTANISLPPTLKLPAYGVYAVQVRIGDWGLGAGRSCQLSVVSRQSSENVRDQSPVPSPQSPYLGVANLGLKPTVAVNNVPTLEVHLFDVEQELYGKKARVTFVDYLRPEQKFSGVEALVAQIRDDCVAAKMRLAGAI